MYEFTEDCLTGIAQIDEEHSQLFQMMNEAHELLTDASLASVATARNLVAALRKYAEKHFETEELYMARIHDPELRRQKREHAAFAEKMYRMDLAQLDEKEAPKVLEDLLMYLSRWLYHHILGSDIMIGKIKPVMQAGTENAFAFTDEYRTHIPLVDEEHARLFEIIQDTSDIIHDEFIPDKYDEMVRILAALKEYTVMHFTDEEQYMESIHYTGLDAQKRAHEAFVEKLNEINLEEADAAQQEYLEDLIDFLLGWLKNHILKVDKLIPGADEK